MATVSEAIEAITTATGLPEARVLYAARYLRDADTDLWPKGRRGGGKGAAHVDVHHLVNLLIAVLAADPLTHAPDAVWAFRSLEPQKGEPDERTIADQSATATSTRRSGGEGPAGRRRLVLGDNFGYTLEILVTAAMNRDHRAEFRDYLKGVSVAPRDRTAMVETRDGEMHYAPPRPAEPSLPLETQENVPATSPIPLISNRVIAHSTIFEILADVLLKPEPAASRKGVPPVGNTPQTSTPASDGSGPAHDLVSSAARQCGLLFGAGKHFKGSGVWEKNQSLSQLYSSSPSRVANASTSRDELSWNELIG